MYGDNSEERRQNPKNTTLSIKIKFTVLSFLLNIFLKLIINIQAKMTEKISNKRNLFCEKKSYVVVFPKTTDENLSNFTSFARTIKGMIVSTKDMGKKKPMEFSLRYFFKFSKVNTSYFIYFVF